MATSLSVDEIARRLSHTLVGDADTESVERLASAFDDAPEKLPEILDAAHRALTGKRRHGTRFTALLSMVVYPAETLAGEEDAGAVVGPTLPQRVQAKASAIVRDRRVPVRQAALLLAQIGHARLRLDPGLESAAVERFAGRYDELGAIAPGLQGDQAPEAYIDGHY